MTYQPITVIPFQRVSPISPLVSTIVSPRVSPQVIKAYQKNIRPLTPNFQEIPPKKTITAQEIHKPKHPLQTVENNLQEINNLLTLACCLIAVFLPVAAFLLFIIAIK